MESLEEFAATKRHARTIKRQGMKADMEKMKCWKAKGPSGLAIKQIKALGEERMETMNNVLEGIWQKGMFQRI